MKSFYSVLLCFVLSIGNAQVACVTQLNLSLDNDGRGSLSPAALLVSVPEPGFTYSISPNRIYTCADIGTPQYVTVTKRTLTGDFTGSCTTLVMIEDKIERPPLTLAVSSSVNVNLGFGRRRTLTPEMFLIGTPCPGCTYTITPSSVSCAEAGTFVPVTITVTSQFCQVASVFSRVNVVGGIGCALRMSIFPFWPNRSYLPGSNLPFYVNLDQLSKKSNFKQVYAHFYISSDKSLNTKNAIYLGNEKLNANQKQKKSSIVLPKQMNDGYYYVVGILTDSPIIEFPDLNSDFSSFEFIVKSSGQSQIVSQSTSISGHGHQIFIDGFEGGEVKIYDINGHYLKRVQIDKGDDVNLEGITKGILLIQAISRNGEVSTHKYLNP